MAHDTSIINGRQNSSLYETLVKFYETNYLLIQEHKYSLTDIENMIPWEREIYLSMLREDLQQAREEQQRRQMAQ